MPAPPPDRPLGVPCRILADVRAVKPRWGAVWRCAGAVGALPHPRGVGAVKPRRGAVWRCAGAVGALPHPRG